MLVHVHGVLRSSRSTATLGARRRNLLVLNFFKRSERLSLVLSLEAHIKAVVAFAQFENCILRLALVFQNDVQVFSLVFSCVLEADEK